MTKWARFANVALVAAVFVFAVFALTAAPEVAAKGGKPGTGAKCCSPALEPGKNGNPFCFEGHSCCSDGRWRCNLPNATPSCPLGTVCS